MTGVRRASFHAKTVELQPHELPPPPSAAERVVSALGEVARWAPDLGDDMAAAIADLLEHAKQRIREAA